MDSYKISFRRSAEKELRRATKNAIPRLVGKIESLSENPRPSASKMLQGEDRYWRLRVGDCRVVYEIDDAARAMMIIKIGHRREIHSV